MRPLYETVCIRCGRDVVLRSGRWEHKPLPVGWIDTWTHWAIAA